MGKEIFGIGIDIVEIPRIMRIMRGNRTFLKRFFSEEEARYSLSPSSFSKRCQRVAARFAVKEAVIKACGVKSAELKKISVVNSESGAPSVRTEDEKLGGFDFMVSLTHSENFACAAVLAFRKTGKK